MAAVGCGFHTGISLPEDAAQPSSLPASHVTVNVCELRGCWSPVAHVSPSPSHVMFFQILIPVS